MQGPENRLLLPPEQLLRTIPTPFRCHFRHSPATPTAAGSEGSETRQQGEEVRVGAFQQVFVRVLNDTSKRLCFKLNLLAYQV